MQQLAENMLKITLKINKKTENQYQYFKINVVLFPFTPVLCFRNLITTFEKN